MQQISAKGESGNLLIPLKWSVLGTLASSVGRVVVLAALARLVKPHEFGQMAATNILLTMIEVFGVIGLAPAVIQKPCLDLEDLATARLTSLSLGLLAGAVAILGADLLAAGMRMGEISSMIRV